MQIIQVTNLNDYSLPTEMLQMMHQVPSRDEIFLALKENDVCGIGIRWTNRFHPTAKYVRVIGNFPLKYLQST